MRQWHPAGIRHFAASTPILVFLSLARSGLARSIAILLAGVAIVALAGCGSAPTSRKTATPTATATPTLVPDSWRQNITLEPSVSLTVAVRLTTDLGLEPANSCNGYYNVAGQDWTLWSGVLSSIHGTSPTIFAQYHTLTVAVTPLAPADWLAQLRASVGVAQVQPDANTFGCGGGGYNGEGTPPAGSVIFLAPTQTGEVVDATFATATGYDAALDAVTDLGFRLADPCYEQAQPTPPWHPMGQETPFAASHTLVLATTPSSSTQWQQQLAAAAGVTHVAAPYTPTC